MLSQKDSRQCNALALPAGKVVAAFCNDAIVLPWHLHNIRVDAGTLALHALYYDLASGTMYVWNAEAEDFEATKLSEL